MNISHEFILQKCVFNLELRAWLPDSDPPRMVDQNFLYDLDLCVNRYEMLSTGLKDNNGETTFQGDILKNETVPGRKIIEPVIWEEGRFWLPVSNSWPSSEEFATWSEVIGNVFEHLELLKAN